MRLSRLFLALTVFSAPLNPVLCPTPAVAQQAPAAAPIPCDGRLNVVRLSDIKPGMMDQFLKAVAAQQAWYKAAGTTDKIGVMRILEHFHVRCIVIPGETLRQTDDGEIVWRRSASQVA